MCMCFSKYSRSILEMFSIRANTAVGTNTLYVYAGPTDDSDHDILASERSGPDSISPCRHFRADIPIPGLF